MLGTSLFHLNIKYCEDVSPDRSFGVIRRDRLNTEMIHRRISCSYCRYIAKWSLLSTLVTIKTEICLVFTMYLYKCYVASCFRSNFWIIAKSDSFIQSQVCNKLVTPVEQKISYTLKWKRDRECEHESIGNIRISTRHDHLCYKQSVSFFEMVKKWNKVMTLSRLGDLWYDHENLLGLLWLTSLFCSMNG